MSKEEEIDEILSREDAMFEYEANIIATAVTQNRSTINTWLLDIIMCDGTSHESKLAAIIRGMLLKEWQREDEQ